MSGRHPSISRRALMQGLGLGGTAALLAGPRSRRARAATPAIPTRLLLFWSGSGVPRQTYSFTGAGGGPATVDNFVFPEVRAPLNARKQDLIALENVDMVSATVDPTTPANAHYAGETHSLAATNRANGDTAGGPSFDQYVAKALNTPAPVTKFPSLALEAQVDGNVSSLKVCTTGAGQVVSLDVSPSAVYKRLFSGFMAPATMPVTGPSAAEIAARQQQSVLDLVAADFTAIAPRLPAADRAKLDAHAQAVRDLEKRLALAPGGGMSTGAACKDPGSGVLTGTGNAYPGTAAMYDANFASMSRLVQSAFACDLTRVALLSVGEPGGSEWGYTSGSWGTTDAHDLIHKTGYNGAGTLKGNADAMAAVIRLHQMECKQYLQMLDLLAAIPEADGTTMLDHTLVLWCSQIAEHGHDVDQLPWILAGGKAVGFTPGRYLRFDRVGGKGAPHNNLFVSLAQGMGLQTNTFGNASVCTGPLTGLRS
jgi:hypothetical protein